jgi:hypothetical protein
MASNESSESLIAEIRAGFGRDGSEAREVPKPTVLKWMRSPDLHARGALYSLITDGACARMVTPPLEFDDYYPFVVEYLEECIEKNPDGEWVDTRYIAGHELVSWIVDFWKKQTIPRSKLAEIKGRLAELYKRGDADVRDGVVNGVLEHLFETRELANYFKEWEADPILRHAYRDAMR